MESTGLGQVKFRLTDKQREFAILVICLACLVLFATSAYDKIVDHDRFMTGLSKVSYIGEYAFFISWTVPIAEIITSLFLLYPRTYRWGLIGFIGLMVVFTIYIGSMLLWAEKLPCHCNLIIEKLSFTGHLAFNIGFIIIALIGLWLSKQKENN